MTKEDCYLVGKLTKTHGLKGEMAIWLDVDYPEEYEDLESILVEMKGELIPYFVEQIQIRANKSIIKFEDVDSIEAAQNLINCDLYLPNGVAVALTAFFPRLVIIPSTRLFSCSGW